MEYLTQILVLLATAAIAIAIIYFTKSAFWAVAVSAIGLWAVVELD